ncbi:MAG: Glutathione S-transferase [Pseudomonadota bacterium]|jgi:glutathione S-transferase
MYTLYYSPGACSLSPHIVLHESGLPFQAIPAPTKTKQLPDGSDYRRINPLGYVPLLQLPDGQTLTEGTVIAQYIADQVPALGLAPAAGTLARYRLMEWMSFISTELHKGGFTPLFNPAANDDFKASSRERLATRFAHVEAALADRDFLLGDTFTVADAYLFVVTGWTRPTGIDLTPWPRIVAFRARVAARPAVQAALKAEGLG